MPQSDLTRFYLSKLALESGKSATSTQQYKSGSQYGQSSVYCDEWVHLSGLSQFFENLIQRGNDKQLSFLKLKRINHTVSVKKHKGNSCFTS